MRYEELKKELKHKKRTIKDLISVIGTRASESTPNYSLLLGAGASVTSGIRTGEALVEEWRKEAYESMSSTPYKDEREAKDYLQSHAGSWYSVSNEYSSLFENKFDLAPQRRRFVEREVDNKLPSIGYSYLVSLTNVNDRYVDTIYTTNFDDLLNEAFYQFSQVRPIVCAHDSSVSSLSMNSNRPKIIKLHGDYLFDDIKSTLRETESLETNIKNKLIEFSKDYGLIVVGYSGSDRSIMDVISHLLKTEEYLKNGIYWCLRPGDYINAELRKLLWKEKVYYVEILGFDQLMAEVHNGLKGELSLKENFTNTKKDAIALSFTEDRYKLSLDSEYIRRDIEKLKKHKDNQDISNLIRDLSQREISDSDDQGLSEVDFKNLLDIDNLIKNEKYIQSKDKIKAYLEGCEGEKIKTIYIKKLIDVNEKLGLVEESIGLCDELIQMDEYDPSQYIFKAELLKTPTEKVEFLNDSLSFFESTYYYYNKLVSEGLKEYDYTKNSPAISLELMESAVNKSLRLEPSVSNPAWNLKLDVMNKKFKGIKDKKRIKERDDIKEGIASNLNDMNSEHTNYFRAMFHDFLRSKNYSDVKSLIDKAIVVSEKSRHGKKTALVEIVCDQLSSLYDLNENEGFKKDWTKLMESGVILERIKKSDLSSVLICQSHYFLEVEKNIEKSILYIKKAMKLPDSHEYCVSIVDGLCSLTDEYDLAEKYLLEIESKITKRRFYSLLFEVYLAKKCFDLAEKNIDLCYESGESIYDYVMRKSFLMLKWGKYDEAISFIEINQDPIKVLSEKESIKVNLETAKKLSEKPIDEVGIRNIISHGLTDQLKLCAESLLGQEVRAKRLAKEIIDKKYFEFFVLKTWPAVPSEYLSCYSVSNESGLKIG